MADTSTFALPRESATRETERSSTAGRARAALAAATLKELGFENVANLDGGFAAWKDVGLPTVEHHAEM
jgi:3-mercaptopyruvate sulfurtransferase SseA